MEDETSKKIVKYNKYYYSANEKKLFLAEQFQANVNFSPQVPIENHSEAKVGDLLKGFFKFYSEFPQGKRVIQISVPGTRFTSRESYERDTLSQMFEDEDNKFLQNLKDGMYSHWAYMIADPFDKTYNPARNLKLKSPVATAYLKHFQRAAQGLSEGRSLKEYI